MEAYHVSLREVFSENDAAVRVNTNFDHGPFDPVHRGVDLTYRHHEHPFGEIVVVLDGEGDHIIGEERLPFHRYDVFHIPPGVPHHFEDVKHVALVNLIYLPEALDPGLSELKSLPGFRAFFTLEPELRSKHQFRSRLTLPPGSWAELRSRVDGLLREERERRDGYRFSLQMQFNDILIFFSRNYASLTAPEAIGLYRIAALMGKMERELERRWTVDELCEILHVSRSTLRRLFIDTVGCSAMEYLNRMRLERSISLLQSSDASITEIGLSCGFSDSNYFIRRFSSSFGCSPLQWRRKHFFSDR
ncbi:helix-turn-helix domain-containing protein, partial [Spirochaeta dissipatitropha]